MNITTANELTSSQGPQEWFTGEVEITPLVHAPEPARLRGVSVTFAAGARTAWHTHPLGQTLIITAGKGLAQSFGAPPRDLRVGDIVWFAPGEKHWHGAAPDTAMTHIALQEELDGVSVEWMEHVSDAQYGAVSD